MFTRFGLWYLATLAPAVILFKTMTLMAPMDGIVATLLAMVVTVGVMPILPIVMLAVSTAMRVDTDAMLPGWYRKLFGAAA